jgi:hypothetical protein
MVSCRMPGCRQTGTLTPAALRLDLDDVAVVEAQPVRRRRVDLDP